MALRNRIGWLLFVPLLCWLAACAPAARLPALTAVPLAISPQGAAGRATQAPFTAVPATQARPITTARPSAAAPRQPAETAIPVPAPNVPTLATVTPAPPFPTRTIDLDTLDRLQLVGTIGYGGAQAAAIAPDGRLLAAGTTAGLALFELPGVRPLRFDLVDGGVDAVATSPDGSFFATRDSRYLDPPPALQLRSVAGDRLLERPGRFVAFSPDGRLCAIGANGTAYVWRIGQPQPFAKLAADAGDTRLIFSADNQLALVGGPSGVRVFSLPGGTLLHNLAIASQDIAIGPRRRLLALVHDGAIQLWGVP